MWQRRIFTQKHDKAQRNDSQRSADGVVVEVQLWGSERVELFDGIIGEGLFEHHSRHLRMSCLEEHLFIIVVVGI